MQVIKFHIGAREQLAVFERVMNAPGHRFHRHMLVSTPVHEPNRKRDAMWIDLAKIRVEWIRGYLTVEEARAA